MRPFLPLLILLLGASAANAADWPRAADAGAVEQSLLPMTRAIEAGEFEQPHVGGDVEGDFEDW